jgi:predicted 3-demethylubiquinone-9 3-methyltransferase (glyoxalase superfamily)
MAKNKSKITPYLWFDGNAEEAIKFYTSIFKNSEITNVVRSPKDGPVKEGTLMTATFELEGQEFNVLNGGPQFRFNEAVSFFVQCETQEEVDYYWKSLVNGGEPGRCGWLKDKFGLSWQIVPTIVDKLLNDKDPERVQRVMKTFFTMDKIDIRKLEQA